MEVGKLFVFLMCLEIIPGRLWAEKDLCDVSNTSFTIPCNATILGEWILCKLFLKRKVTPFTERTAKLTLHTWVCQLRLTVMVSNWKLLQTLSNCVSYYSVYESTIDITASETVIERRIIRIIPLNILIGLFISEMFTLIMGSEIFCKGCSFKNCSKCFSQSTEHIIINVNAICFGYKRIAIIRPELQDTKWGLSPAGWKSYRSQPLL